MSITDTHSAAIIDLAAWKARRLPPELRQPAPALYAAPGQARPAPAAPAARRAFLLPGDTVRITSTGELGFLIAADLHDGRPRFRVLKLGGATQFYGRGELEGTGS